MRLKAHDLKTSWVRLFLTFLCAFAISLVSIAQQSSECLAVITDLNGDVSVLKTSVKKIKAVWGTQLFEGDKIITAKNSKVALLFSNGNIINLGANSNLEMSGSDRAAASAANKSNNVNTAMMANFSALTFKRKEEKDVGIIAGLRDGDKDRAIELITPCNTLIKELDPIFYWKSATTMEQFQVKLFNSKGLVWSRRTAENKLPYPADEKVLEYGESYFWNVEGEIMLESFKSINMEFTVLSRDERKMLDEQEKNIKELFKDQLNSCGFHSLLGACYMNAGLYEDAIDEFSVVSEIKPDAALPHEILGNLYTAIGNKDRAISELQKALEINKKED